VNVSRNTIWSKQIPLAGIIAGFVCIGALSMASYASISELPGHTDRVNHTHLVQFRLEQTMYQASDVEASTRGFAITGNPDYLLAYSNARKMITAQANELAVLTADNPDQRNDITQLNDDIVHIIELQDKIIASRRERSDAAPALTMIAEGRGKLVLDDMRALVNRMQSRETALLQQREATVLTVAKRTKFLIIFGTVLAYMAFGGAFWFLAHEVHRRQKLDFELQKANDELVQRTEKLEITNKELDSFSYSVSHDLRVPLRAIAGYASMLAEDYYEKLDGEGQRLLNVIRESSKRMGTLIDDLLAFSKFGKQPLTHVEIDMRTLALHAIAELQGRDNYSSANAIVEAMPAAWGDYALIRQVCLNLISNALKYSSKKALPEIRISGEKRQTETIYAVSDNGAGFDMQYYNKLFGVFQRLHSADEFAGTGVGLAIIQRIVQRHGGRVWAEGAIDQGATFFFALPNRG